MTNIAVEYGLKEVIKSLGIKDLNKGTSTVRNSLLPVKKLPLLVL